jgi:hypothetical protein
MLERPPSLAVPEVTEGVFSCAGGGGCDPSAPWSQRTATPCDQGSVRCPGRPRRYGPPCAARICGRTAVRCRVPAALVTRGHCGGGLLDERGDRGRLRLVDGVAAGDLDHGEAGPLRHGALGRRGDHPILGREQVPARLGPPGRVGDRSAEGVHAQGTWESAMNAACSAGRPWNFSRSSSRKPSLGGRIGGTGAPGGGLAIRVLTDSPLSGANAAM